jgi:RNA polymerase sigma factor (sigma-70 family)
MEAYERYGRALVRRASRLVGNVEDARDLVQGLFADLYGRADVPLELPSLYRAITHRALSFLRDESTRARLLERHDAALAPPPRTKCDDHVIGVDLLAKLVQELGEGELVVLTYRYMDDMTQDEIATLLGLSRKTVGKRLDRVRDAVRRLAGADGKGGSP